MITKASIRRFLWRHCIDLHSMIYKDKFNEEEKADLIGRIKKGETDSSNNNQ
jgi:hypothetical protein